MLIALGLGCVVWTVFELTRMWNVSRVMVPVYKDSASARRHSNASRAPQHFAAWDDRGRPIKVEDLG